MENIKIFGTRVDKVTLEKAIEMVEEFLQGDRLKTNIPNTEIIMAAKKMKI